MKTRDVRLGDVVQLQRRRANIDPAGEYVEVGLRSFGRGLFLKDPVSGATLGNKRVFSIEPGDLVISNVFAWEGAVALAGDSARGTVGSHRFMTWTSKSAEVDLRYLCHYFVSERGLAQLQAASPGSAGRNKTLGIKAFEDLTISLPSLTDQRRIAAHLDRVEAHAHATLVPLEEPSKKLTALAEGAYARAHGSATKLDQLVEQVIRRERVDDSAEYSMLGVRWYADGLFVREQVHGNELSARHVYRVRSGDLVYNRLFAWKGSFALAKDIHDCCTVSNEFPTFRVRTDRVLPRYLLGFLSLPSTWDRVAEASRGGTPTSRNRLKETAFLDLDVPLPSYADQQRVRSLLARDDLVRQALARRWALAQNLLPAARNEVFASLR